jgi:hypothetical protein
MLLSLSLRHYVVLIIIYVTSITDHGKNSKA